MKELSLKRTWEKNRWLSKPGRAAGTKEDAKALNVYLDIIKAKAHEVRSQLIEKNTPITALALKDALSGAAERRRMFIKIFEDHNEEMKKLVDKEEYSGATIERFTTAKNFTIDFLQYKYKQRDINIHLLDLEFVKGFYLWLRTVRNCSHNTAIKYIANIKKVVLLCVAHGWLKNDPWALFSMKLNEVDTLFLTKEELETIVYKVFTNDRLAVVRDIFVFCCLTGLAFGDICKLRLDQLSIGIDGKLWIEKRRKKTSTPFKVPLLQWTLDVIERYKGHDRCKESGLLLPVSSNSTYNEYLKEIAALCGINKVLTSHVARHTFATTVTLLHGIPLEVVRDMLGHKSIKQTEHYSKVLPIKISFEMNQLEAKLQQTIFNRGADKQLPALTKA